MGIVLVVLAIARLAGTGEETMIVGLSRTSSAARAGSLSRSPLAQIPQCGAKCVDLLVQAAGGSGVKEAD